MSSTPSIRQGQKGKTVSYSAVETQDSDESQIRAPVTKERLVANWPSHPQRLKGVSIPIFLGDCLLVLLPIAFIGKQQ
jgi:hypothetical protein